MTSATVDHGELPAWLRWASFVLGVVVVLLSVFLLACPPVHRSVDLDSAGNAIKTTLGTADVTSPFLAVFIAGIVLVLFGINGRRFTRITAGDYSADSQSPIDSANRHYKEPPSQKDELTVSVDDEAPEPTEPRLGVVTTTEGDLSVYNLTDVPSKVIRDALQNWPTGEDLPDDLQSFEFATRRPGKGNHPWTLKFRGKRPVVVSYGGRGKSKPTVESPG